MRQLLFQKKTTKPSNKTKPWFDNDCKNVIKERAAADRRCKKYNRSDQTLWRAQLIRAKCRRVIKRKKRASWRQFVSSINSNTPVKKVWNKIRKITGKNNSKILHHVEDINGDMMTGKK